MLKARTPRSPNQGARRAASTRGRATASTASWPSSTPRLNDTSATGTRARGSAMARSAPAKPNPCTRPNGNVMRQRSITMNPNSCEKANEPTTVLGAGRSPFGSKVAGSAVSRLSPPLPATNVAGWLLAKSSAWKSCTWP